MVDLKNKKCVITGGAGYLGQTFAEALTKHGATCFLLDLPNAFSKNVKTKNKTTKDNIVLIKTNCSNISEMEKSIQLIKKRTKTVDILINNAAFSSKKNVTKELKIWGPTLDINLRAPFFFLEKLIPLLKNSKNPSVINIASIYGFCGPQMNIYKNTNMQNEACYAASKGGLIQITRYYATKLAPKIRVNAISPGGIYRSQEKAFVRAYESRTPMQRMATEEDMVGPLLFLASSMSKYVTGQNLVVDGGWSVW